MMGFGWLVDVYTLIGMLCTEIREPQNYCLQLCGNGWQVLTGNLNLFPLESNRKFHLAKWSEYTPSHVNDLLRKFSLTLECYLLAQKVTSCMLSFI